MIHHDECGCGRCCAQFYEHLPATGGPGAILGGALFLLILVAAVAGAVGFAVGFIYS